MANFRIPPAWEIPERLATPESTYLDRRQLLAGLGLGSLAMSGLAAGCGYVQTLGAEGPLRGMTEPAIGDRFADRFPAERNEAHRLSGDRALTPEEVAAGYNNFYEFTTTKDKVWTLAQRYSFDDWRVEVRGAVKSRTLALEELLTLFPLEERLYRFRCVERWAMQVPWTGYPLRKLIEHLEPRSSARYVRFTSINDPERLPGQESQSWYPWPYFEGLRIDEALNDLAFVAVGIYGHALPMQHGAPWRLALPWKYGYKGPKSIVRIDFLEKEPETFWHKTAPTEYGFYSNINPERPHPRWSQAEERDIGTGETRPTLLYGGYGEQVASLYDGGEY